MIQLFAAFIDEVAHRGVRGLAELIAPQLGKAVDFFGGVLEKYRKRQAVREQRAEAERIAAMTAAQVADDIRDHLKRAFPDNPDLRQETELYLSLAPGMVRRSLRRADDPSGRSAPPDFALSGPDKVAALFPPTVPTLRPGDPVPGREEKYRLVEPIGGGGFGEVWKAADLFLPGHFVALKVFPDPNVKLHVIRHELTQARRLNHPEKGWPAGVVPVVDSRLDGDRPWIMYEFVGGGTLADLIVQWQALPVADRVKRTVVAIRELALTCGHMHALRPALVHRDLKPANVLRTADGAALKITDLGLGGAAVEFELATESQGYRSVTGRLPSQLFGSYTLNYASPQQRRGEPPDPRDDVHALGVIAYQMLTGKLDAAPGTDAAEELKELTVPPPVVNLVKACTASSPARRPENGAAVAEAIAKFTTPKAAVPLPPVPVATPVGTPVVKPLVGRRVEPTPLPEEGPPIELSAEEPRPRRSHGNKVVVGLGLILLAVAVAAVLVSGRGERSTPTYRSPGSDKWGAKPYETSPGAAVEPGEVQSLTLGSSGETMAFCYCPPGTYRRGSDAADARADVRPVKEVRLTKGLWMAKHETTVGQWRAAMTKRDIGTVNVPPDPGTRSLPVTSVSWDEAQQFCRTAGALLGRPLRLPTEAEWEYACRAGSATEFCSGDGEAALRKVGWFDDNSSGDVQPVGRQAANGWGLHDMHGNVWEWCADSYDPTYYATGPTTDPMKYEPTDSRVYRGGSVAKGNYWCCMSAFRSGGKPDFKGTDLGFRVCFTAE